MKIKAILLILFLGIVLLSTFDCGPATKEAPPSLRIGAIKLCSDVRGDREYTARPDAIFQRGERVWLYFEASGIMVRGADGKYEAWVKLTRVKIYDPAQNLVANLVDIGEIHETFDEIATYVWFYVYFDTTEDNSVGQYKFNVTVVDELAGETATADATCTLE